METAYWHVLQETGAKFIIAFEFFDDNKAE
jgi:hypothetical protein